MRIFATVFWSSVAISTSLLFAEQHELVEKILKGEESAFEELRSLPEEEKFDILFLSYYTTQATKIWREERPDLVDKIRENLNQNLYLKQGLVAKFKEAMKPKNGRQRELLFRIAGTLNGDVVTPLIAEFLSDQRTFEQFESEAQPDRYLFEPANSYLAARTLGEMGIANPPTLKDPLTYRGAEVNAWQNWWSKVADAGEIEFNGDIAKGGIRAVSAETPKEESPGKNSDLGFRGSPSASTPSKWPWVLGVIALLVVVVISVWAIKGRPDQS